MCLYAFCIFVFLDPIKCFDRLPPAMHTPKVVDLGVFFLVDIVYRALSSCEPYFARYDRGNITAIITFMRNGHDLICMAFAFGFRIKYN